MNLTIPVTISILLAACGLRQADPCFFHHTIPDYLFFEAPPVYFLDEFITRQVKKVMLFLTQLKKQLYVYTLKVQPLGILLFKNIIFQPTQPF